MVTKSSLRPSLKPSLSFKPFDKTEIIEVPSKSSSKSLHDPTLKKFGELMDSDEFMRILHARNVNVYAGKDVYANLAKDLRSVAAEKGIRCGIVIVKYKNSTVINMFNAFKIKGEGLTFIDIENDGAYDLDTFTGHIKKTTQYALFRFPKKVHYVTRSGTKRNIASITIRW
jgi:hypothetical protein